MRSEEEHKDHQAPLPRWDLRDLFPGDDRAADKYLIELETEARRFADTLRGKVARLSPTDFADAIEGYEKILEKSARVESYARLMTAADRAMAPAAHTLHERLSKIAEETVFFALEINKMKEADLYMRVAHPRVAPYAGWVGRLRAMAPHQLPEDVERYLKQKSLIGEEAWKSLYDEMVAALRIPLGEEKLTAAAAMQVMNHDEDPQRRRAAFDGFMQAYGAEKKTITLIFNTLAALKQKDDARRGFDKAEDRRHIDNQIDGHVVAVMTKAAWESYPRTAHRYYAWKARKSGTARLHPADRLSVPPLMGAASLPEKKYSWAEAKDIVLAAFDGFSPEMGCIAREFFDKGWIDAEPRAGKRGGAFCNPAVPSAHPYVLMNFFGSARDVLTLAHELGHGVHQVLAGGQGFLKSDTPLTISETASLFAEGLVFRLMLARETDAAARRRLMMQRTDDLLNASGRQVAFHVFEQKAHAARRADGDLSPERLETLWRECQKENLGPAVNLDVEGAANMWMAVPHFFHAPFYVYAYAFGAGTANTMLSLYDAAPDKAAFAEKYIGVLKAGGSLRHEELLSMMGVDAASPSFWKQGFAVIERQVEELIAYDAAQVGNTPVVTAFRAAANDDAADLPDLSDVKPAKARARPGKRPHR